MRHFINYDALLVSICLVEAHHRVPLAVKTHIHNAKCLEYSLRLFITIIIFSPVFLDNSVVAFLSILQYVIPSFFFTP